MLVCLAAAAGASGCASLAFTDPNAPSSAVRAVGDLGLPFYVGAPYLVRTVNGDCSVTSTLLMLPSHEMRVTPRAGWGSNSLTVEFANGMITKFGQETDTKGPETLTALLGASGVRPPEGLLAEGAAMRCRPFTDLHEVSANFAPKDLPPLPDNLVIGTGAD